jgi:type I restriction enzyme, S subunit
MGISERWSRVKIQAIRSPQKYSLVGGPFGSNLISRDYQIDGVPVIRGVNLPNSSSFSFDNFAFISEEKADSLFSNNAYPGDLIFTQRGTLGQIGLIPQKSPYKRFVISQSQMKLTVDKKKADARFVYYYFRLSSTAQAIENYALSSGIPHINLDILRKFEILLPPLNAQKKITSILSAYDDLIENNKRRIALLEKMAEEIYREWFVRMRFPGHEQVVFHKGIPAGWERKKFKDFCLLQRGFDITQAEQHPGDVPIVSSSGITSFHNQWKAKSPGVVTGRKGTLGKVYFVDLDYWPHDTTLWVKDTKGNSLYFIYYLLKLVKLESYDVGASNPTLNRNHLGSQDLIVPSQDLQKKFETYILPIFEQKKQLGKSIELLQQTRDRLLPRLISGKLPVEDLDIQFPPSMTTHP